MKDDAALNGMNEIAAFCKCSRPTIHRWINELGFPVVYRGNGRSVFTTKFAIGMWVVAVSKNPSKFPIGGLPRL